MRGKIKLLLSFMAATFALPALAEDVTPRSITGNLNFTSDYAFRGISQNLRRPALQGGIDYAHSSGLYLGIWGSAISGIQYTNSSMEWDFYGGYNGKINDDLGYTLGLVTVYYPGGTTNTVPTPNRKFDTTEWNVGVTWKGLNVKYSRTLTNWFGVSGALGGGFEPMQVVNNTPTATTAADVAGVDLDSRGSGYIEANYTYELPDNLKLSGHAGRQKINNYSKANFTDYRLGLSRDYAGFTFGLAYTVTNAADNTLYHVITPTDNKKLGDGMLAVSVSRVF